MMERSEFDALVTLIDRRFAGRTEALTRHTYRWMLLGYFVVILLTLVLIGSGLALFVAGIVWSGAGVWMVVAGGVLMIFGCGQVGALVIVEQPEPTGLPLEAGQGERLRQLLHMLCTEMRSPYPERIILTEDFNAAIAQQPRLGIFGWSRSWLILGVPLLLAVSPDELAAVLAHECGHLSLKHGRQGNRIYQMHRSWERLFHKLQQGSRNVFMRLASSVVIRFMKWYWPRFHARASVLSRRNEFLADARAAQVTSADSAAAALYRLECLSYFLEQKFWNELWDETAHTDQPPTDLCRRLRAALQQAPQSKQAPRWCEHAMQRISHSEESHPTLAERLLALGLTDRQTPIHGFPPPPKLNALDGLLPDRADQIEVAINERWCQQIAVIWRDRHRRICRLQLETENQPSVTHDHPNFATTSWEQTRRLLNARGLEAAEPQLRQILAAQPEHPGAAYAFGQLRLDQGHADGETLLRQLFDRRTLEWTEPAGAALERHYMMNGQSDRAAELREQLDRFEKERVSAEEERLQFDRSDVWDDHGLSEGELVLLNDTLSKHESCRQAWLVEKRVQHFTDERLFVMCVESTGRRSLKPAQDDQLIAPLMVDCVLPGRLLVITPTGEFRQTAKRIINMPHSCIYEPVALRH